MGKTVSLLCGEHWKFNHMSGTNNEDVTLEDDSDIFILLRRYYHQPLVEKGPWIHKYAARSREKKKVTKATNTRVVYVLYYPSWSLLHSASPFPPLLVSHPLSLFWFFAPTTPPAKLGLSSARRAPQVLKGWWRTLILKVRRLVSLQPPHPNLIR